MKKLLAILAVFAITIAVSECKRHQNQAKGRRRGRLGGASPGASAADCAKFLDIKLYADSPGYHRFKPDAKACKAGPSYVGSTEDGNCHVTLVPSGGGGGGGGSGGDAAGAFAASVTCDDTGAVYSIGQDGNGTMTVVERLQEDYGPELDPPDDDGTPPEERALLLEAARPPPAALDAPPPAGGPRGGVAAGGDRSSPAENIIGDHRVHRDLQVNVDIDVLVLYTAHAECRNAGRARGCQRDDATRNSILGLIDLAVAETNTAYSLSGVNVELNLVHAAFDTYVEASTNAYNVALTDLRTNDDGKLDQAHALRTTYGADVVALIIDDSQYCGIAYLGPSINYMFSVTSWNCATGYYSFGHEIGHNFGCNHDRGTSDECTNTKYNYGFRDPDGQFRSILAYACRTDQCDGNRRGSCPRVQRFSNNYDGYNLYNGKAIGNVYNNNARRMNDVASTISNYYSTRPPTQRPTLRPTASLTSGKPSQRPTTAQPTTLTPTSKPSSRAPTVEPTTSVPTTREPTDIPTQRPTTARPTTRTPTNKPSTIPPTTRTPTNMPTQRPTTARPTTRIPTNKPSTIPPTTRTPTDIPTQRPTTAQPTTLTPTNKPSTISPTTRTPTDM